MLKKFLGKINSMMAAINGTSETDNAVNENQKATKERHASESTEGVAESVEEEEASSGSILHNAIDTRDRAVKLIVDSFRNAMGTRSSAFRCLTLHVVYKEDKFDPLNYPWADEKLVEDLRRELDNSLLSAIGSESITIQFVHEGELDTENMTEIAPGELYVSWKVKKIEKPTAATKVEIRLIETTGSLVENPVILTTDKPIYHIGRGAVSRSAGAVRYNDVVIRDDEPDESLLKCNQLVSSCHADIVVRDGKFCLRASAGGCRGLGGAATKLISGERIDEMMDTSTLRPLKSGDLIELGKSVTLRFTEI
ncbi:MAG: hypothetical protein NC230_06235 [Bacteroides sp.]|nr:hypothetical protein [Bacteroides sp.]